MNMHSKNQICITIFGGMGDVLALTPSLKALKQQNPGRKIVVFFVNEHHQQLLENNPYIDRSKCVKQPFTGYKRHPWRYAVLRRLRNRVRDTLYPGMITLSVGSMGTYAVYRIKMAHILAERLQVQLADTHLEIHLSDAENERGKTIASAYPIPVMINPVIRSRRYHTWPIRRWEALIKNNPDISFLQLGLPDEPAIKGAVDLRNKSPGSLREMIAILKYADAYVGMDTFWQHAAAAVDTPGVVLFGDGHPAVFGHDMHTNIYKNFRCAPCLPRGLDNNSPSCPYDAECITSISVDEVTRALLQQLSSGKAGCGSAQPILNERVSTNGSGVRVRPA